MSKHYSYTSPDDPEPLICDQCAVYAEKADYWLAAKERTDSYLDAEMARRRAAEDERDALRADRDALRADRDVFVSYADKLGDMVGQDDTESLHDAIARVMAERDALRADAERYRWLRKAALWTDAVCEALSNGDPVAIDAAIDAARGES